jgi:O-6-methylguanine DNA methyltransferase
MSKGKPRNREEIDLSRACFSLPVSLPFGWASVVFSGGRLISVEWEKTRGRLAEVIGEKHSGSSEIPAPVSETERVLEKYAGGEVLFSREIAGVPVAWDLVRRFYQDVLRETARIPYGRTVTYGELAARIGNPGAARAVGAALSANPWPVIVPCHRVIGSGGNLVGFGKGLDAKAALLEFEKANLGKRTAQKKGKMCNP